MIDKEELLAAAKTKSLTPRLAELDYLQDIALANTYSEFGSKIVFKGGTCLYKVFQLNRFSEDLDFTAVKGFKQKDFFKRLPFFFNLLDIKSSVRTEDYANETNVLLTANGPLYDGTKESQARISFNISFRERVVIPTQAIAYRPIYRELRTFNIYAMDETEILAEKILAIYARNKARDVFDAWYLLKLKQVSFDVSLVNKKLSKDKIKFEKNSFLTKVEEKKSSWEKDLSALVAGELPEFSEVKKEIEYLIEITGS